MNFPNTHLNPIDLYKLVCYYPSAISPPSQHPKRMCDFCIPIPWSGLTLSGFAKGHFLLSPNIA